MMQQVYDITYHQVLQLGSHHPLPAMLCIFQSQSQTRQEVLVDWPLVFLYGSVFFLVWSHLSKLSQKNRSILSIFFRNVNDKLAFYQNMP